MENILYGYRNVIYLSRERCVRVYTWDENGNRIYSDFPFSPYFYVETNRKEYDALSLYNTKLRKIECATEYERRNKIEDSHIDRIFYNLPPAQQFLIDNFGLQNEDPHFTKFPLKVWYLDLEVYIGPEGAFPDPAIAQDTINVITVYDTLLDKFITWGLEQNYTPSQNNVEYIRCVSERDLLIRFINYMQEDFPDIILGWNSVLFDFPYLCKRISNILEDEYLYQMSPLYGIKKEPVYERQNRNSLGQFVTEWYIDGITLLDYLDIYKLFSPGEKENYRLNTIGELELGETKVDVQSKTLNELADSDWQRFVDYNIQDVNLLKRLDDKLKLVNLIRMLAYIGMTQFRAAMGTISTVNGQAAIQALKSEPPLIIPTFKKGKDIQEKYEGGYVGEPKRGFSDNVISFDANSLYPSTMITLNLSPETKVGQIVSKNEKCVTVKTVNNKVFEFTPKNFIKWCQHEKICISKADKLFSQKKKGIFPQIADHFYNIRKKKKQEWTDLRTQKREIDERIKELEEKLKE